MCFVVFGGMCQCLVGSEEGEGVEDVVYHNVVHRKECGGERVGEKERSKCKIVGIINVSKWAKTYQSCSNCDDQMLWGEVCGRWVERKEGYEDNMEGENTKTWEACGERRKRLDRRSKHTWLCSKISKPKISTGWGWC